MMPAIQLLDPEKAHRLGIILGKYNLVPKAFISDSNFLESTVIGIKFPNPIGIAAGYDKNGEAVESLFRMGFGYVEVGSITPKPQPGNPKPRVFRVPEISGIINRYGFNSDGFEAVYERLSKLSPPGKRKGVLGVNLGKNKDSKQPINDYVLGVQKFGPLADYLVINISSPNTPGLRDLQHKMELENLTSAIIKERNNLPGQHKPPILLKISPDLTLEDKKDIVAVISKDKNRVDGLIICNTTTSRPSGVECKHINEQGGLSGQPLKDLATSSIKDFALLTKGKLPIIGVGGIRCGIDAKEKIYAGASLVQIYSSFAYEGPPIVRRISSELENELK
ncbi:UNVERIFIED_CONTAM: hypothetical protein GTU68_061176 [Idotea baltica]|nr:hypothetical protein [Idotea baltica]